MLTAPVRNRPSVLPLATSRCVNASLAILVLDTHRLPRAPRTQRKADTMVLPLLTPFLSQVACRPARLFATTAASV